MLYCLNRNGFELNKIIESALESNSDFIPLSQYKSKLLFKDKSSIGSNKESMIEYTTVLIK